LYLKDNIDGSKFIYYNNTGKLTHFCLCQDTRIS